MRQSLRGVYRRFLLKQMNHPSSLPVEPAVVFAPHPDDETLGCGGTIIQKRQAGAPVKIAFVTDGSRSHQRLMPVEALRELRMREALDAGRVLGVAPEEITFLQIPNGELVRRQAEATEQVAALLAQSRPGEVYLPSALDFHAEHRLTNQVVQAALARLKRQGQLTRAVDVFEYPIWFWYQWPWVPLPPAGARERAQVIKRTLRYGFGLAHLARFRYAIQVSQCQGQKRLALEQHRSQMTRLVNDTGWSTLPDLAGGEFIACFFAGCEWFSHSRVA